MNGRLADLQQIIDWLAPDGPVVASWQALLSVVRVVLPLLVLAWLMAHAEPWLDRWLCRMRVARSSSGSTKPIRPLPQLFHLDEIANGDLCDVRLAQLGHGTFVLKIPRIEGADALLRKEQRVLEELTNTSGHNLSCRYFPQPAGLFSDGRRLVGAFRWQPGLLTAEQVLAQRPQGLEGQDLVWIFHRILEALAYVHRRGWVHGAVLPPHLLLHVKSHHPVLIDWIHAERIHSRLRLAPERFQAWYPPECHSRGPATPATDIYLAAKTTVYLAGGEPVSGRLPRHMPMELQQLIGRCLGELAAARPRDAGELGAEVNILLKRLYGAPHFHELVLT